MCTWYKGPSLKPWTLQRSDEASAFSSAREDTDIEAVTI